jgi:hypothetical protein
MDVNHRKPVRKVAAPCRLCGREFFHVGSLGGRRQEFCSGACRQADFRNRKAGAPGYPTSRYETPQNSPTNSIACEAAAIGRGSFLSSRDWPIDLVGGCRRGSGLGRDRWRKIIAIEIGGRRR